jgi:hypothetical protein
VLVGVDALEVELRSLCGRSTFEAYVFRGAIDVGVRMLGRGRNLAPLASIVLLFAVLTHMDFPEARTVAFVVLMFRGEQLVPQGTLVQEKWAARTQAVTHNEVGSSQAEFESLMACMGLGTMEDLDLDHIGWVRRTMVCRVVSWLPVLEE